MFAKCIKTVEEFGEVKFKKDVIYKVDQIHDLILIIGEQNKEKQKIIFQVEQHTTNSWLQNHFVIFTVSQKQKQRKAG